MGKASQHVERTFRDLADREIADLDQALAWSGFGLNDGTGWPALLESQRVLIFAEAGAGKTFECREQQKALWDQGEAAFFLDLSQLSQQPLSELLIGDEEARFALWKASQSEVATFFLDSVDELRITLGSFEVALRRLRKEIEGHLGRVRIVVTSRPIPVDQEVIRRLLPVPEPVEIQPTADGFADIVLGGDRNETARKKKSGPAVWRNVALMPFSDAQIREMAAIQGIVDADEMIAEVRRHDAETFARRPQDLIELCADWPEFHRIRSHADQVANNVAVKLKPREGRMERAQLSPDKKYEGASRLALAAILTRKLTIRHSVEADQVDVGQSALEPSTILHDWSPDERQTLLERPLFGFATYGRVRFHHRSVMEFLAAEQLALLLDQGRPIKGIKRLLFATTPESFKVVKPTMRPVAAWLARKIPAVYSEVRDREPETLLDYADPGSLSVAQRVETLGEYVRRHGPGAWRGMHVPRIQVSRFASTDLADAVQELWKSGIENNEIREFLLEVMAAAPLPSCADIALGQAFNETVEKQERVEAVNAVIKMGEARIEIVARSMLDEPPRWPDDVVRSAILNLFPEHIAADQLCALLARVRESRNSVGEIGWMLPRKLHEVDVAPEYLEVLREGLTDLITEGVVWQREWPHIKSPRPHLIELLSAVCLRLIGQGRRDPNVLRSAVIALRLVHHERSREEAVKALRDSFAEMSAEARESAFWLDDAFSEGLHAKEDAWNRLFEVAHHGPLALAYEKDSSWVVGVLADRSRPVAEREMMIWTVRVGVHDPRLEYGPYLTSLRQYVEDEPALTDRIDALLAPRQQSKEETELNREIQANKEAREKEKAKHHQEWRNFWLMVSNTPEKAFSTEEVGNTVWALWQSMRRSGDESRASGWNRRFMEDQFGKETADLMRTSLMPVWRADRPTLRSERPAGEKDTFFIRWQLGLAGIYAEAEDPDWANKLSEADAELAARYVPIEFNGFPAWLEQLAAAHPHAIEGVLGPQLSLEIGEPLAANSHSPILQNLSHGAPSLGKLFLPHVVAWFREQGQHLPGNQDEGAALRRLEMVVNLMLASGDAGLSEEVHEIARAKATAPSTEISFTSFWTAVLMRLDPEVGVTAMEERLKDGDDATSALAVPLFASMFGRHTFTFAVNINARVFTPRILFRLTRLAYRHIRREQDLHHEGSYSPGPRDDAQEAREQIVGALLSARGPEAWAFKLKMTRDPLFAHFRDRIAQIAREKSAEEADAATLTEAGVVDLNADGETAPLTREEMFALLIDRLDDIDDLLLQDISPRGTWAKLDEESLMRRELARELHNAARHAYTVDQEGATADEKETDIRLRSTRSEQEATIELKLGASRSARDLRDTLRAQLVTKYMAAEKSRSGCLVVAVAADRGWDHPDTRQRIDLDGLRELLSAEAEAIMKELPGNLLVAARILDLRPRLPTEKGGTKVAG